jgi:hypothetical protein
VGCGTITSAFRRPEGNRQRLIPTSRSGRRTATSHRVLSDHGDH